MTRGEFCGEENLIEIHVDAHHPELVVIVQKRGSQD